MKKYDAVICEGKMGAEIAHNLFGNSGPEVYTIFNGMQNEHFLQVNNIIPDLESKNIIFLGQGPSDLRFWYKGLDLMLKAFSIAFQIDDTLKFKIVGDWDNQNVGRLVSSFDERVRNSIIFVNYTDDLAKHFKESSLYLHCARGEAFGIAVLLALTAGVPAIVSNWTGTKEVVEKIDPELIVELDENRIAEKILWYYSRPLEQKKSLSNKSKNISIQYTEQNVINNFQKIFNKVIADLDIRIA